MHDERAAADAVDDLVDEIDQVFRGTALGCVRGGQRFLDLDVVAAGRHQVLDVPADGRDERFGAVAAVAVDRAEVVGRLQFAGPQPVAGVVRLAEGTHRAGHELLGAESLHITGIQLITDEIVYRDDLRLFLRSHAKPHLDPEEK